MFFKSRKKDKTINCFPPNYKKKYSLQSIKKNVNNKQMLAEYKENINNKQLFAEYKDPACLARQAAGGEQRQVRRVCQRGEYLFFRREYSFLEGNILRWIITHNSERWLYFFQKGIYFYFIFLLMEARLLWFLGLTLFNK